MSRIKIFDTTLRDGEQSPGCSMNLKEKIEVTRCLERLKVDVIEAGFAISSPGDFESVQTIARTAKDCSVASLARATVKDIESLDGTIEELLAGRVDATLNAEVSINNYMTEKPDAAIKIVAFDPEVEKVGMIMPNNESTASLQEAVNQALKELRADGTLKAISEKYFGMDITTG